MPKKIKTLDIILIAVILAGTAFGLYLHFDMNKTYPDEHIAAMFEPITSKYGIRIVCKIGDDFFSPLENPPIPVGPPKYSKVKPIRHSVLLRYPEFLQKAFNKYPVKVIQNYINAIYFAKEIDIAGRKAGGTYDPFRRIIYLVDNGGKNSDQAMSTFHHEFSSLLINRHSFWINPWTNHHPKGFKYLDDIYDTWKEVEEAGRTFTDNKCYKLGFVSDYGLTNFSNDFSEYSEMIFTYPERFKKIMDQYPRVRGKFLVWLDFYQKIDPVFTEEYLLGN
jgi:hypothetical protein